MKIILVNGSSIPLYEQIYLEVKQGILAGDLAPDTQLPSVRELSRELRVSILTVKKAYDALERDGFVVVRQGLGSFVAPRSESLVEEEYQKALEDHLVEAARIARRLGREEEDVIALFRYLYGGEYDT